MRTHARAVLALYTVWLLGVGLFLQVFLALGGGIVLLRQHPYLPLGRLLSGLPDLVLAFLPVTIPFTVVIAFVICVLELRRTHVFHWIAFTGGSLRRPFLPVLVLGLGLSLGLAFGGAWVFPQARFQLRYVLPSLLETPQALAARIADRPGGTLMGLQPSVGGVDHGDLLDVGLVTPGSTDSTAIVAHRSRSRLSDDARNLWLDLDDGRMLRWTAEGGLETNVRFDTLRVRLDTRTLGAEWKQRILTLRYYTDAELDLLDDQYLHLLHAGHPLDAKHRARIRAIPAARRMRLQSAALPLLLLVTGVVTLLPRGPGPGKRGLLWFSLLTFAVVLQMNVMESRVEKHGHPTELVPTLLPTLELAAVWLVVPGLRMLRRGRRS